MGLQCPEEIEPAREQLRRQEWNKPAANGVETWRKTRRNDVSGSGVRATVCEMVEDGHETSIAIHKIISDDFDMSFPIIPSLCASKIAELDLLQAVDHALCPVHTLGPIFCSPILRSAIHCCLVHRRA